ncbi:MAG: exonuclease domain-containing protein [Hyphomicrobiaceae bacterium]
MTNVTVPDPNELHAFDKLLVIDLEATCSRDNSIPPGKMETIEIGAVVVAAEDFSIVNEFQSFVRPVRHPNLTEFCKSLTGITQDMVDQTQTFFEVFTVFDDWINENAGETAFCSWGAFDRRQLEQDCAMHGLTYAMPPHVNLKALFSNRQGFKKRFGMAKALAMCDIELAGQHHRALDDARNISRLLPWIAGDRTVEL